jgi:hypothetical protein
MAVQAEPALLISGSWQRLLLARWLRAEADRAMKNFGPAHSLLTQTLQDADTHGQPQISERCLSSLGLLALQRGDPTLAEENFKKAIALTEEMRDPIPGEEFRTAFFADRLSPYKELVKLCLNTDEPRTVEALGIVESARSRGLADAISGRLAHPVEARDDFEAHLLGQAKRLREVLNYLYKQMHRSVRCAVQIEALNSGVEKELLERERKLLEITRQLQHRGARSERLDLEKHLFSITQLQSELGTDRALVEFTTIDDELIAFVVTDERIDVVRDLGREADIASDIGRCRFQIDTLRYGSAEVRNHLSVLTERTQKHLRSLYDRLLRSIEPKIDQRRLVIVPHHALHYLPFHALHDGQSYLIERREVSYAPSAVVLLQCLRRSNRTPACMTNSRRSNRSFSTRSDFSTQRPPATCCGKTQAEWT